MLVVLILAVKVFGDGAYPLVFILGCSVEGVHLVVFIWAMVLGQVHYVEFLMLVVFILVFIWGYGAIMLS